MTIRMKAQRDEAHAMPRRRADAAGVDVVAPRRRWPGAVIADGTYPAGSRLPGEIEIAAQFGVNRHTVRRAIVALAERGVVRAERGSGTYVEARRIPYPIRVAHPILRNCGNQRPRGRRPADRQRDEPADRDIARRLRLKEGAPVVRIETLRFADRVPICIGTSWLPAERFPDAGRVYAEQRSMTRTLAHFGVRDYRRADTASPRRLPTQPTLCGSSWSRAARS